MSCNADCMYGAISPLDGRYRNKTDKLAKYFSEEALMDSRLEVELEYLLALDKTRLFKPFTTKEKKSIQSLLDEIRCCRREPGPSCSTEEGALKKKNAAEKQSRCNRKSKFQERYRRIKEIEAEIRHDVKACELYLRETLELMNPNLIHFGLTSEDVNNLAYSLLFKSFNQEYFIPLLGQLVQKLSSFAREWSNLPFPARTHGQHASPTTAGKEMAVHAWRLLSLFKKVKNFTFCGKLNGATGNLSAHRFAFPDFNWPGFSKKFVESLSLEHNPVTTQIENHDRWCEYFDLVRHTGLIVLDLDLDMWLYISYGYFKQKVVSSEVGSSTMPHKVNPVNFETSEGNLKLACSLLSTLSLYLTRSRMQRDLSDSTLTRNAGVALSHLSLGLSETLTGLSRIEPDSAKCLEELRGAPELLAEPVQTLLRTLETGDPYSLLKSMSRGKKLDYEEIRKLTSMNNLDSLQRQKLETLKVENYLGYASEFAMEVAALAESELGCVRWSDHTRKV